MQKAPWASGVNEVVRKYIRGVIKEEMGEDQIDTVPEDVVTSAVAVTHHIPPVFDFPNIMVGCDPKNEYSIVFEWDWGAIGKLGVWVGATHMKFFSRIGESWLEGRDIHNGNWCPGVTVSFQQAYNAFRVRDAQSNQQTPPKSEDEDNGGPFLH